MEKYYRFAGVELAVCAPEQLIHRDDRTLSPFRVSSVTEPHRFAFETVSALTPPSGHLLAALEDYAVYDADGVQIRYLGTRDGDWRSAHTRAEHRGMDHRAQLLQDRFADSMSSKTVLNAIATEHLLARAGGFVFHTAYIAVDGGAVLFTAPSGTGKSTQAELWRSLRGAEIVNGDRAAIYTDGQRVLAAGIPFAGSSNICLNRTLPLRAIVYLSQAPRTTVCRLQGARAFARIWEGVSVNVWDREDMERVSAAVEKTVHTVPVFHLACTPDESAVAALEQLLGR